MAPEAPVTLDAALVEDPAVLDEPDVPGGDFPGDGGSGDGEPGAAGDDDVVIRAPLVVLSAAIATCSAAWMATRLFRGGVTPVAIALIGVAIGAGFTYAAARFSSSGLQYATLPAALVTGAVVAVSAADGGSLPTLVSDALRGGGLLQPPIPFEPGWRFLLVVVFAFVTAGAASLAIGTARPKLAVIVPVPVALGAALIQPKGSELVTGAVGIVLLVAALAVAYGAVLAADGALGGGFETRRLLRGAALMAGVVIAVVGLAQTDFLFPDTEEDEVIPPQKPPTPPPSPDRELFTVRSEKTGPWRVGVLDVYQDNAFLLPSQDPKRLVDIGAAGTLSRTTGETYTATFRITDLKGQSLLLPANAVRIEGTDEKAQYDPRTQLVRLVEKSVPKGFTYTIVAPVSPDAKALAESPDPRPAIATEFAAMPPAPPGVQALLAEADGLATNRFDRLQFVRAALYGNVVAAGAGKPVDVPPRRVDEMIAGGEATPYEISAAEVMLARWAGIPARLGFGFFGGESKGEVTSFRPRHGAAWLEAYFEASGWIPIIGTPPKAKPSLSNTDKKQDPNIVPTDELALSVHVPVERPTIRLVYELVRYYVVRLGPLVALAVLVLIGYPALVKTLRAARRRRWAATAGARQRVLVAYTELRDACHDLNVGDRQHTPLQFLWDVVDDREHEELAWLVTRAMWGDLVRDLRLEDVEAAEEMARSVQRRIASEQTGLNRLLAATSRASLRDPWSDEVPNLWRRRRPKAVRRSGRFRVRVPVPVVRGLRVAVVAAVVVGLVALAASQGGTRALAEAPSVYPDPLLPATVLGQYELERRPEVEEQYDRPGRTALVTEGRVFTVRSGDTIQGSVQIALFRRDVDASKPDIQRGIEGGLGSTDAFRTRRFGTVRLRELQTAEEQIFVWFPPDQNAVEVFIMRKGFTDAAKVVRALITFQRTAERGAPPPPVGTPPPTLAPVRVTPTTTAAGGAG